MTKNIKNIKKNIKMSEDASLYATRYLFFFLLFASYNPFTNVIREFQAQFSRAEITIPRKRFSAIVGILPFLTRRTRALFDITS